MMREPIDAVITWVDGHDPCHQEKIANYLIKHQLDRPVAAAPTRFNQQGEIDYCVRSILQFAPWIRTIHIVTDNQIPPIIHDLKGTVFAEKINLINHNEIFHEFEHCLPTFNSLTIESVLWRIKGLANQFIYFNDDCILIRPVAYEDFFRQQQVVLRGQWKVQSTEKLKNKCKLGLAKLLGRFYVPTTPAHRLTQEKSAQTVGNKKHYFHLDHVPFPLKKSTLESFFKEHGALLKNNIKYPFRHPDQIWVISLAYHLEIKNKQAIIDNSLKNITIHADFHTLNKIYRRLKRSENSNVAFICLQSIDKCSPNLLKQLVSWLDKKITLSG